MLDRVAEFHGEWITVVKQLGGNGYSEDIVQEMYLKITKYSTREKIFTNNELNKGYIYFTLKSILYTYFKQRSLVTKVGESYLHDIESDDNNEELTAKQLLSNKVEKEINSWHWYDREIFNMYRNENISFRKIQERTKIHWTSIYRVVKNCKEKLKDKLGEDYTDFLNKDYELIKK